jgi:hypothetical protein
LEDTESPEGIERRHIHEAGGRRLQSWPVGLVGLAAILAASAFGVFGTDATFRGSEDGTTLTVEAPRRIRNGEFFEMRITVELERRVSDLVIRIDEQVWHDVTINTFFPSATGETHRDGAFEFRYGPLEAGSRHVVKVDGQINPDHPPSANEGRIGIADGDGPVLAAIDYRMEVLP